MHGGATEYHHDEVGINSRLDAIQAAILRVKLNTLTSGQKRDERRLLIYTKLLREADLGIELVPPFVAPAARHIFHQYVVRIPEYRDAIMKHLADHGVGSKVYYPVPLHLQNCFAFLGYGIGAFPEAESAANETLALPCFPEITEEQQRYVVEI